MSAVAATARRARAAEPCPPRPRSAGAARARGAGRPPRAAQRAVRDRRRPLDRARPGARRLRHVALRRPRRRDRATRCGSRRAMTLKAAAAGLDLGGGKGVICASRPGAAGERAARRCCSTSATRSSRSTAATSPPRTSASRADDMAMIASAPSTSPGCRPTTAARAIRARSRRIGVEAAMRACCAQRASAPRARRARRLRGRRLGHVGATLARRLRGGGRRASLVSDIDPAQAARSPRSSAPHGSSPTTAMLAECDVLAPCALGGAIDARERRRVLRCAIVCGCGQQPARRRRARGRAGRARDPLRARLHRQRRRADPRLPGDPRLPRGAGTASWRSGSSDNLRRIFAVSAERRRSRRWRRRGRSPSALERLGERAVACETEPDGASSGSSGSGWCPTRRRAAAQKALEARPPAGRGAGRAAAARAPARSTRRAAAPTAGRAADGRGLVPDAGHRGAARPTAAGGSPTTAPASWSATRSSTCGRYRDDVHEYVRGMEQVMIARARRVRASRPELGRRATGVWTPEARARSARSACTSAAASPRTASRSTSTTTCSRSSGSSPAGSRPAG